VMPALKAGKYQGQLVLTSDDLHITGEGITADSEAPNRSYLDWAFSIPQPPLPWYALLLIVISILLGIMLALLVAHSLIQGDTPSSTFKGWLAALGLIKPKLDGVLYVREPVEHRGEEYTIGGRTKVKVGSGGDLFSEADSAFTIEAVFENGRISAVLKVLEGNITLKKNAESQEVPVYQENIVDGDEIGFSDHKVIFQSFNFQDGL